MVALEPTLLAHTGAVVAQAATGVLALMGARRRRRDGLLGTAMLVGAALTALDATGAGNAGLPLASLALLAFGLLATIAGRGAVKLGGSAVHLGLLAAMALAVLHQTHTSFGVQASWPLGSGSAWQPLDLGFAAVLGWLATRGLRDHTTRAVLGVHAAGLAAAAFLPAQHALVLAATQVVATAPFLARALLRDWPQLAVASATAIAFGIPCVLRAATDHTGTRPQFAGMQDPLLACALLPLAFGAALLRAYRHRASASATQGEPRIVAAAATDTAAASTTTPAAPPAGRAPASEPLSTHDVLQDLRQPVTSMLAAAGLLTTSKDGELANHVDTLRTYGQQLANALSDLEDFEQLQQGRIDLADDTFDLHLTLRASVAELQPTVADRSIELRLDLDRSLPRWIQGDQARTQQLLVRLLQAVGRRTSVGPIDISAAADDLVHVSVLARTATLPEASRHLGIAYCRQLARTLGGELRITMLPDVGVELRLNLPKRLAPEWEVDLVGEDDARSPTTVLHTDGLEGRVLLVEDSPDHLLLVGRMLARTGVQVSTANSGELALHLLAGTTFDLLLVDMQLPGIDGYTTVQRLREQGIRTPVLALTADTALADVERCLAAGCNGHLGKPVDFRLLHRALAMHLATSVG